MKIRFLVPYPLKQSPSQRFRFEQYFKILSDKGHSYDIQSFLDSDTWRLFFKAGNSASKFIAIAKGFARRYKALFSLSQYDFVFIHREAAPLGPPIFEWIIAKLLNKKIIYDFDDAIWMTDRATESLALKILKWRNKVSFICRWSYRVSCGNYYLCQYASQFASQVFYNPTTIDTENLHYPSSLHKSSKATLVIGWTGSHSTLKYLKGIEGALQNIEQQFPDLKFMVIADHPPDLKLKNLVFTRWTESDEIYQLRKFDIGVMPLPDDEWSRGKCGFKALQYMALGIPTVASPVGVNLTIIQPGENGFLASTPSEWESYLKRLILDQELRTTIGRHAREKVERLYSVRSNAERFLRLFDSSDRNNNANK
jgi:glycosyltransferase involved in cell wall biosynthesis